MAKLQIREIRSATPTLVGIGVPVVGAPGASPPPPVAQRVDQLTAATATPVAPAGTVVASPPQLTPFQQQLRDQMLAKAETLNLSAETVGKINQAFFEAPALAAALDDLPETLIRNVPYLLDSADLRASIRREVTALRGVVGEIQAGNFHIESMKLSEHESAKKRIAEVLKGPLVSFFNEARSEAVFAWGVEKRLALLEGRIARLTAADSAELMALAEAAPGLAYLPPPRHWVHEPKPDHSYLKRMVSSDLNTPFPYSTFVWERFAAVSTPVDIEPRAKIDVPRTALDYQLLVKKVGAPAAFAFVAMELNPNRYGYLSQKNDEATGVTLFDDALNVALELGDVLSPNDHLYFHPREGDVRLTDKLDDGVVVYRHGFASHEIAVKAAKPSAVASHVGFSILAETLKDDVQVMWGTQPLDGNGKKIAAAARDAWPAFKASRLEDLNRDYRSYRRIPETSLGAISENNRMTNFFEAYTPGVV